jgi:predicted metal-dependent phosphoesterase TrpH
VGLGCIAVADHNTAAGSLKLKEMAPPFKVIVAEEILTPEGEIIGLFIQETIPPDLSPEEAIRRIHEQGGLACIPHPFDRFRPSAMQGKTLERIVSLIDIVEVANARTLPFQDLSLPLQFARKHNKPMGAGSDSHTLAEIGRAYVEMEDFETPQQFLEHLKSGVVHRYQVSVAAHARTLAGRLARKVVGRH